MADNDDHQPDFDDAFRDEPASDAPLKRFSKPRRGSGDDVHGGATGEVPRPTASGARRRGGSSRRKAGGGAGRSSGRGGAVAAGGPFLQNPRARLGLAVLFALILTLVIVLVVRDCQRSQLENSYTSYLNSVAQVVQASADQGRDLREVLSNAEGLRPPQLRERIQAIATQADGLVDQSRELNPPGALAQSQASLVTLLQYRVTGLTNLANNLPALLQNQEEDFTANGIADQMQRFLASDVIYQDSFAAPASAAMAADNITGVEVPKLQPFLTNVNHVTTEGAKSLLPGLRRTAPATDNGEPTAGNLRGNQLIGTEALPSGTRLSRDSVTTIEASENLEWRVTVKNGGDFVENNVVVSVRFSYPSSPNEGETQEATIPVIEPDQEVSVTLPGPSEVDYREQGVLVVDVKPVPGETVIDNNTLEYAVRIAL